MQGNQNALAVPEPEFFTVGLLANVVARLLPNSTAQREVMRIYRDIRTVIRVAAAAIDRYAQCENHKRKVREFDVMIIDFERELNTQEENQNLNEIRGALREIIQGGKSFIAEEVFLKNLLAGPDSQRLQREIQRFQNKKEQFEQRLNAKRPAAENIEPQPAPHCNCCDAMEEDNDESRGVIENRARIVKILDLIWFNKCCRAKSKNYNVKVSEER